MNSSQNSEELRISQKPVVRWTLKIAGSILVGIGVLGMFLPLLPTTVFLLMAAWCFARSSPKYYHWLHTNKHFGSIIRNYRQGNGIALSSKISSITILWVSILYSILYAADSLLVRLILAAIAIGVTIHLVMIPTYKPKK
ncbi:MAG: YbaN family protein [Bacteroidota bacterium]|jgi:hypothetical protein